MIIEFQIPRTNPSLHDILTNQYINRYVNEVAYTIGGHQDFNEIQKNLMWLTKNASVYWLTSQNLYYLYHFFPDEVILVDTNRILKVPDIEFGEFLRFIGIWMLMTENPGTNWEKYFRKNPIDLFSGCVSTSSCLEIVLKLSAMHSSSIPPPPPLSAHDG